jgi:hypothetical protein
LDVLSFDMSPFDMSPDFLVVFMLFFFILAFESIELSLFIDPPDVVSAALAEDTAKLPIRAPL